MPDYPNYPTIGPPDVLSDEGVALNYYRQNALEHAGWTQDAVDWANQQGIMEIPKVLGNPSYMGAWDPSSHTMEMRFNPNDPPFYRKDAQLSQIIEHEMMHGWDYANGMPSQKDFLQALQEMQLNPDQQYAAAHGGSLNQLTWRNQGRVQTSPQDDALHYNQTLFNRGFTLDQIPQWYKDLYLQEYNP